MMLHPRARDLTGQKFGRLTVLCLTGARHRNALVWRFQCDCGVVVEKPSGEVTAGRVSSCGCFRKEQKAAQFRATASAMNKARATHGHTVDHESSTTFMTWTNMIQRCTNPKHKSYKRYGGRGIHVCGRWLQSFESFLADMGEKPAGMELDRRENNRGYWPDNCWWVTRRQNMNNTSANRPLTHDGRTQNIKQWAAELGISHQAINYRLKVGWNIEDALTTKTNHGNAWIRGTR